MRLESNHMECLEQVLLLHLFNDNENNNNNNNNIRPDPALKLSAKLYCCVYGEKLLMMDRGTVRNM